MEIKSTLFKKSTALPLLVSNFLVILIFSMVCPIPSHAESNSEKIARWNTLSLNDLNVSFQYQAQRTEVLAESKPYQVWTLDRSPQKKVAFAQASSFLSELKNLEDRHAQDPISPNTASLIKKALSNLSSEIERIKQQYAQPHSLIVPVKEGDFINFYAISDKPLELKPSEFSKVTAVSKESIINQNGSGLFYLNVESIQLDKKSNTEYFVTRSQDNLVIASKLVNNLSNSESACQEQAAEEFIKVLKENPDILMYLFTEPHLKGVVFNLEIESESTIGLNYKIVSTPHRYLEVDESNAHLVISATFNQKDQTCDYLPSAKIAQVLTGLENE